MVWLVSVVYLQFTQYGRERGGRQDFRCVKLIWQLGMLWLWFILSQQFLKIFQEWSSRSAWSLWSTCNSHSVAEEGEGKTAPAVLGWYGSCGCFGCDLFSASILLKFTKNSLHGLPGLCDLLQFTQHGRERRWRQNFSCVRLICQLWLLWLWFILSY